MRAFLAKKVVRPFVNQLREGLFRLLEESGTNWRGYEISLENTREGDLNVLLLYHDGEGEFTSELYWVCCDERKGLEINSFADLPDTFPSDKVPTERIVNEWIEDVYHQTCRRRLAKKVSNIVRQELVAAVWHPRRVAWRLEEGGWDALEAM